MNPKNLLLAVGAATSIAATGLSVGQQVVAYTIMGTGFDQLDECAS